MLKAVGPEMDAAKIAGDDDEDVKDVEDLEQVRDPPAGGRLAVVVVVWQERDRQSASRVRPSA